MMRALYNFPRITGRILWNRHFVPTFLSDSLKSNSLVSNFPKTLFSTQPEEKYSKRLPLNLDSDEIKDFLGKNPSISQYLKDYERNNRVIINECVDKVKPIIWILNHFGIPFESIYAKKVTRNIEFLKYTYILPLLTIVGYAHNVHDMIEYITFSRFESYVKPILWTSVFPIALILVEIGYIIDVHRQNKFLLNNPEKKYKLYPMNIYNVVLTQENITESITTENYKNISQFILQNSHIKQYFEDYQRNNIVMINDHFKNCVATISALHYLGVPLEKINILKKNDPLYYYKWQILAFSQFLTAIIYFSDYMFISLPVSFLIWDGVDSIVSKIDEKQIKEYFLKYPEKKYLMLPVKEYDFKL